MWCWSRGLGIDLQEEKKIALWTLVFGLCLASNEKRVGWFCVFRGFRKSIKTPKSWGVYFLAGKALVGIWWSYIYLLRKSIYINHPRVPNPPEKCQKFTKNPLLNSLPSASQLGGMGYLGIPCSFTPRWHRFALISLRKC